MDISRGHVSLVTKITRQSVLPGTSTVAISVSDTSANHGDCISDTYRRIQEYGCLLLSTSEHVNTRQDLLFASVRCVEEVDVIRGISKDIRDMICELLHPVPSQRTIAKSLLEKIVAVADKNF